MTIKIERLIEELDKDRPSGEDRMTVVRWIEVDGPVRERVR